MGAADLLNALRGRGVAVNLADGELVVTSAAPLADVDRQALRQHKADVLAHLQTATAWHLADGTVYVCPPETRTEVEARFGQSAEPFELAPTSCRTCAHLSRPGLSDGYCGGRTDLPRAYGPDSTHPLRELPADGGRDCLAWAGRGGWA